MTEQEFQAAQRARLATMRIVGEHRDCERAEADAKAEAKRKADAEAEAKRAKYEEQLRQSYLAALMSNPACDLATAERLWREGGRDEVFKQKAVEAEEYRKRYNEKFSSW